MKKPKTHSRKVLVIEENPAHAELITEILDKHFTPITIHIVDSTKRAFGLLKENKYNAILTDTVVEESSITLQIKKIHRQYETTPIIVITGSGDETLAAQLIKQGISEYLVKTKESVETLPEILERYLK